MRRDSVNYLLAGTVVLLALLFAGWILVQLTGQDGDVVEYQTRYGNVYGLRYGTPVFYQGYRVGQVERIEPQQESGGLHFVIWFSVAPHWQFPADSRAVLTSAGLLADVYIEIQRGQSTDMLPPGGRLAGGQVVDVFAAFSRLADEAVKLTREGLQPLAVLLNERLGRITEELADAAPDILRDGRQAASHLRQASVQLQQALGGENRRNLDRLLADSAATASQLRQLSASLQQTRARLDAVLEQVDAGVRENRPELHQAVQHLRAVLENLELQSGAILDHLERASGNLDGFSRAIYRDPSRLLKSVPEPGEPPP